MGGNLDDGTKRETNNPWPSEKDDKRVNNFFVRNYACQYGELTDAKYTIGYARAYADYYRLMYTRHRYVSMPGHF